MNVRSSASYEAGTRIAALSYKSGDWKPLTKARIVFHRTTRRDTYRKKLRVFRCAVPARGTFSVTQSLPVHLRQQIATGALQTIVCKR